MAKFDIKTVKPKFVVTTSPENKIDVVVNKPIIETKLSKSFFKLKNVNIIYYLGVFVQNTEIFAHFRGKNCLLAFCS